jgi:hypothetical protein
LNDPRSVGKESVTVEIVGRVRTNINSAGAETTGTLVASNNVVWELDLNDDAQLIEAATGLGISLARVKGQLIKLQGNDARIRWIVKVDTLESLDLTAATSQSLADANNRTDSTVPDARTNPMRPAPDATPDTRRTPADFPQTAESIPTIQNSDAPKSFQRLSIVTTDGQSQSIFADGQVRYESKTKSSQWLIKPEKLDKLHQFIAETRWDKVPRVNRVANNAERGIGINVSIETESGVTRIFADSAALPGQPTLSRLFGLIRREN